MNGMDFFKKTCRENHINPDDIFQYGRGANGPTKAGRYQVKQPVSTRKASQLFIIQYYKDINGFIAWDLWEGKKGTSLFSVPQDKIKIVPGQTSIATTNAEYSGRGMRRVTCFGPECVSEFLKRYVIRSQC